MNNKILRGWSGLNQRDQTHYIKNSNQVDSLQIENYHFIKMKSINPINKNKF